MDLSLVDYTALGGGIMFLATFVWFLRYAYKSDAELGGLSFGLDYRDTFVVVLSVVPLTSALSYLLMSTGLGFFEVSGRMIPFIRYFEWGISTPLLLFGLSVLVGRDETAFKLLLLDVLMIATGFAAAILPAPTRFLPLAVSVICLVAIITFLVKKASSKAEGKPEAVQILYEDLQSIIILLWSIYPVIWTLSSEGLGLLSFQASFIMFTVLDLTAKIGFTGAVIRSMDRLNELSDSA